MYLSALPTLVLILPINITSPLISGFCLTPLLHSIGSNTGPLKVMDLYFL